MVLLQEFSQHVRSLCSMVGQFAHLEYVLLQRIWPKTWTRRNIVWSSIYIYILFTPLFYTIFHRIPSSHMVSPFDARRSHVPHMPSVVEWNGNCKVSVSRSHRKSVRRDETNSLCLNSVWVYFGLFKHWEIACIWYTCLHYTLWSIFNFLTVFNDVDAWSAAMQWLYVRLDNWLKLTLGNYLL